MATDCKCGKYDDRSNAVGCNNRWKSKRCECEAQVRWPAGLRWLAGRASGLLQHRLQSDQKQYDASGHCQYGQGDFKVLQYDPPEHACKCQCRRREQGCPGGKPATQM